MATPSNALFLKDKSIFPPSFFGKLKKKNRLSKAALLSLRRQFLLQVKFNPNKAELFAKLVQWINKQRLLEQKSYYAQKSRYLALERKRKRSGVSFSKKKSKLFHNKFKKFLKNKKNSKNKKDSKNKKNSNRWKFFKQKFYSKRFKFASRLKFKDPFETSSITLFDSLARVAGSSDDLSLNFNDKSRMRKYNNAFFKLPNINNAKKAKYLPITKTFDKFIPFKRKKFSYLDFIKDTKNNSRRAISNSNSFKKPFKKSFNTPFIHKRRFCNEAIWFEKDFIVSGTKPIIPKFYIKFILAFFTKYLLNDNYSELVKILFLNRIQQYIHKYHDETLMKYNYFMFFLFCFFFDSFIASKNLFPESINFARKNYFAAIYFFDPRFFLVCIFKRGFVNIFRTPFFYKPLSKSVVKFKNFILKVDFVIFLAFKHYVEYFRMFKYNEYLHGNKSVHRNFDFRRLLNRKFYRLHTHLPYYKLRYIVMNRPYNLIRYFSLRKSKMYPYDPNFALTCALKLGHFKSMATFFGNKYFLGSFLYFFRFYLLSLVLLLTNYIIKDVPYIFWWQRFDFFDYYGCFDLLYDLDEITVTLRVGSLYVATALYVINNKFKKISFNNFNLVSHFYFLFMSNIKQGPIAGLYNKYHRFFHRILRIVLVEYIDSNFFNLFVPFEGYKCIRALNFGARLIRQGSIGFLPISNIYSDFDIAVLADDFKLIMDGLL